MSSVFLWMVLESNLFRTGYGSQSEPHRGRNNIGATREHHQQQTKAKSTLSKADQAVFVRPVPRMRDKTGRHEHHPLNVGDITRKNCWFQKISVDLDPKTQERASVPPSNNEEELGALRRQESGISWDRTISFRPTKGWGQGHEGEVLAGGSTHPKPDDGLGARTAEQG